MRRLTQAEFLATSHIVVNAVIIVVVVLLLVFYQAHSCRACHLGALLLTCLTPTSVLSSSQPHQQ